MEDFATQITRDILNGVNLSVHLSDTTQVRPGGPGLMSRHGPLRTQRVRLCGNGHP